MQSVQMTVVRPASRLDEGQLSALLAMDEAARCARENGTAQMTLEKINREITFARSEGM